MKEADVKAMISPISSRQITCVVASYQGNLQVLHQHIKFFNLLADGKASTGAIAVEYTQINACSHSSAILFLTTNKNNKYVSINYGGIAKRQLQLR